MSKSPKTGLFSGKSDMTAFFFIILAALIAFGVGIYTALDDRGMLPDRFSLSRDNDSHNETRVSEPVEQGKAKSSKAKKASKKPKIKPVSTKKNTWLKPVEKKNTRKKPVKIRKMSSITRKIPTPENISANNKPVKNSRYEEPEAKNETLPDIKRTGEGRVAIIIDDFGNNMNNVDGFCDLDIPITFAVLPYLKYSKKISRQAVSSGKEVILHLPLENHKGINPGPGTLKTGMKRDEMIKEFKMDLSFVPGADGFNNHEGSLATENEEMMTTILTQAKEKGLYFIDSVTSSKSVGLKVASQLGVPALRRNVFLDNEDDVEYIMGQLRQLSQRAIRDGSAIGIGHVRKNTLEAIKKMIPEMEKEGVEFVFVRDLVR